MKAVKKYFEEMAVFMYFRTAVTNGNCSHEEIKSR
jgi:hypothetical protein